MFKKALFSVAFSLSTLSVNVWADTPGSTDAPTNAGAGLSQPAKLRWIVGLGYMIGGDKLIDVDVHNSLTDSDSTEDIRAGTGLWLMGGIEVPVDTAFAVQTRIGYLFDSIEARNGSLSFNRYPLDVLPLYNFDKFQVGLGLTYHLNPTFDPGSLSGEVKFKNSTGLVGEFNYVPQPRLRVGLHFTQIDYKVKSVEAGYKTSSSSVNGSGVGIHLTGAF